jgi:RHS repeat-associated protein
MQMIRSMTGASLPALLARAFLAALIGLEPGLLSLARAKPVSVAVERIAEPAGRSASASTTPTLTTSVDPFSFRDAPSDPAPAGSPGLLKAQEGTTAVAGRVLATDGTALAGVMLRLGRVRTLTDKDGLFLLENVSSGVGVMVIDGRRAVPRGAKEIVDHGIYEAQIRAEQGQTTELPWVSWLPRIDHEHEEALSSPSAEDVVVRTPSIPGLELHLPKDSVLTGLDGEIVRHIGLTAIPVNRPPYPLPRNVHVPIYFTAQPGGAVISSANGDWLGAQVVYPNYNNDLPRARGLFWRYESDGLGWSPYGTGTVAADGRHVIPDHGTRIYALSGAMFSESGVAPPIGPPPQQDPPIPNPFTGDPVDLATGLFVQRQTDLSLDGLPQLELTRTYRPGDYNSRAFGVGMSLNYGSLLHSTNQYQVVDLIMPDGGLVHYTRIINPENPTDNNWVTAHFTTNTPGPFYQSRIDWNGNGWNLVKKNGEMWVFDDNAPLQRIQDRFGNTITFSYSGSSTSGGAGTGGNIIQVSSSHGRFIQFVYDGSNRIVQATDNIGRTLNYTYDTSGRLSTVTDPNGGVTTYTWDSSNRVQSIKDARGVTYITNTYDGNDRLTQQVLADGTSYQLAYMLDGNGNVTETDVTDPRGYVRKVTLNAAGYIVTDKQAFGTPQEADYSYTRDPVSNLLTSVIDPLGRVTNRTYDGNGNLLTITWLAGTSNAATQTFSYSPNFNQLASYTDPLGHVTTFQRDTQLEQLTAIIDPLNNSTTVVKNSQGQLVSIADPLSNTTQFVYGIDGDLISVTDPLGNVTRYNTDAIGRQLLVTDPGGGLTQRLYDPINGILRSIDPNGASVTNTYTPVGRLATVTDARSAQTTFSYDNRNFIATHSDAVSAMEQVTQRDGLGNVVTLSDRKSQVTSLTYDPLGQLLTASYADGSSASGTWDIAGRLTQVQDSSGGTIARTYDGLDRVISETTPQGTVSYTYDAAGRRLTMQAGTQSQITYSYDNADHLTGITQGSNSVTFGYDAAGRRISANLPGGITASFAWDANSQLAAITYASGSTTLGNLTYGYDPSGHLVSRGGTLFQSILPAALTNATYNLANRLTARTSAGITTSPTWDTNGNLTSDGVNNFTWDSRNRLAAIAGVASFAYDAIDRRQTATRSGTATSFLYDGWDVIQEQQGGNPSADLLIGLDTDQRFSRSGVTFLGDALGSTVALATAGSIQTNYGYDPYGAVQASGSASDNTYQYTGRENDSTGLLNYRNRYYSPAWGRFISEDPLGLFGWDINLYRYVANSPIQLRDPTGLYAYPGPGSDPSPTPPTGPSPVQLAFNWRNFCITLFCVIAWKRPPKPIERVRPTGPPPIVIIKRDDD